MTLCFNRNKDIARELTSVVLRLTASPDQTNPKIQRQLATLQRLVESCDPNLSKNAKDCLEKAAILCASQEAARAECFKTLRHEIRELAQELILVGDEKDEI